MRNSYYFTFTFILAGLLLLSACKSSQKHLQAGEYDLAVDKAVKKLQRKPDSQEDIQVLKIAYPKANEKDLNRIKFLKSEGNNANWDEIYSQYNRLKSRQILVKTVDPLHYRGKKITFQYKDYDPLIIEAKQNAAAYHYNQAKALLERTDRESSRTAYYELLKVQNYYSNYKDTKDLLEYARDKGTSRALIVIHNNTNVKMHKDFYNMLLDFDISELDRKWVRYYKQEKTGMFFDYSVKVNLKIIDVSPERFIENNREESKRVRDGWEYVLDERGNVKKDSLGNDIRKEKYKTVYCDVREVFQKKSAHIEGTIDYFDNRTGRTLLSQPIAADHYFEHVYASAKGNLDALEPETRRKLDRRPLAFPPDPDMIWAAGETLRPSIRNVLVANKKLLE